MSYRRSPWRLLLAAPVFLAILVQSAVPALAATGLSPVPPQGASPNGQRIFQLYELISIPAIVVFVLVEALLLICVIRFRRSVLPRGYRPPQWHGHTGLEVLWTVAPFLVLVVIGFLSFQELQRDFVKPADSVTNLELTVRAHQFGWDYVYPQGFTIHSEGLDAAANPLVIPTGELVRLRLESTDVIHSWWVPDLTGKTDAVPGYDNYTWVKVAQPGEWRGQCAELCGSGHSSMQIRVKAVPPDQFERWVAQHRPRAGSSAPGGTPRPSPSPSPVAAVLAGRLS